MVAIITDFSIAAALILLSQISDDLRTGMVRK